MEQTSKIKKITVDRDLCIGAATCVSIAPDVFKLDSENKSVATMTDEMDGNKILLAAQSCPVQAISVFDENDKKIS